MGLIIEKEFVGNKVDNKTHRTIPFTIDEECEEVTVYFSFNPYLVKNKEDLIEAFKDGIFNYQISKEKILEEIEKGTMYLNNMISISLYKDDEFLGCSHKHNKDQVHSIRKDKSSHGFLKVDSLMGKYEAIVSFHGIFLDGMNLKLRVETK